MPETVDKIESDEKEQGLYDSSDFPHLLQLYYKLIFPHNLFYRWLSYGEADNYFARREFSFTLSGDVYIRYISFNDADELKQALLQKNPEKIDIGAVYNIPPKDNKREFTPFRAIERELVFDIDMTDYDDVRYCCSGAAICPKCWLFMVIAAKVLNRALTEDFGFKHIFWVYSGRRGIHCWVSDARARKLSFEARAAIADYLTFVEGGEFKKKKVHFDYRKPLHASITKALIYVNKYFERLVNEQEIFSDATRVRKLIDLCDNVGLKQKLEKQILGGARYKNSFECWDKFVQTVQSFNAQEKNFVIPTRHLIEELKLQLCYPRLDVNVSKGLNHLLKSPFSIHPKTGRVCVPIDISEIDSFNPFNVPKVNELCDQIDKYDHNGSSDSKVEPYEKTSLRESVNLFRKKISALVPDNVAVKLERNDASMEF